MEKRRPTYDLAAIKALMGEVETLTMTETARKSAYELGYSRTDVAGIILDIDRKMFWKSMTTHSDHTVWQDVYHVPADGRVLYVKFQADAITEFRVMSFKEK